MPEWNPKSARLLWQFVFEGEWPTSVAFARQASLVAAGNRLGEIFVWDLTQTPPAAEESTDSPPAQKKKDDAPSAPDLPPVLRLQGHTNAISRLLGSPDGRYLYSSSYDHTVCIWDLEAAPAAGESVILDSRTREEQARRLPEKERDAFLNAPGPVVPVLQPLRVLQGHTDWVHGLAQSADGTRLFSGDADSRIIQWEPATGRQLSAWQGHPWNGVISLACSPSGDEVLASEYGYKRDDFDIPTPALRVWSTGDPQIRLDLLQLQFPKLKAEETSYGAASIWRKFVANGLLGASCSPDGQLLAVGQGGETSKAQVHLFEAESGKFLRSLGEHTAGITDVRFSPDSRHVLSTGRDTTLLVSSVEDGAEIVRLGKSRGGQFKDWFHALDLAPTSPSGSETAGAYRLAAADIAGLIHVWECS